MGASVIEKYLTIDRTMKESDHKASLELDELQAMIQAIRNIEKAMKSGEKKPAKSEIANMAVARKSIIAACDIKKGEVLTEENLTTKHPGNEISLMNWYKVVGTKAIRDFREDN